MWESAAISAVVGGSLTGVVSTTGVLLDTKTKQIHKGVSSLKPEMENKLREKKAIQSFHYNHFNLEEFDQDFVLINEVEKPSPLKKKNTRRSSTSELNFLRPCE